jgi:alkaline phosphatase D
MTPNIWKSWRDLMMDGRGPVSRLPKLVVAALMMASFSWDCLLPQARAEVPEAKVVTRIALGSCANQGRKQEIWDSILAESPDLFLFLGDNVYADTEDMEEMRAAYQKLAEKPGFAKLRETCPILAIWDDHDYGVNDGGKEYPKRKEAAEVFHEFFRTPVDSPSRKREGIYSVHYFPGADGQRVQVLLLDTRYFRDAPRKLPNRSADGPYSENWDPEATILGAEQWDWLAKQLSEPAALRIIGSSIQVLPQDHRWERWENFPVERRRLLELLAKKETGPVIFVSGDRHMGEIMALSIEDPLSPGFPVYELTSSGLTNAGGGRRGEVNRHRVGKTNFQSRNFGLLQIDWSRRVVTMELRDIEGNVVDSYPAPFGK